MRHSAARTRLASRRRATPEHAAIGASGYMPDMIRGTVGGLGAHPQPKARSRASSTCPETRSRACMARDAGPGYGRLLVAAAFSALLSCEPAGAEPTGGPLAASTLDAYVAAFALLDRQDIAALALTLGILCFAVVTAILLVRTRRRLAEVEAAARDESIAAKAAIDRAYALLLSEPQILIAWAAATDEPEIVGDPALVTTAETPHRVLAFGTWLEPGKASEMERAVDALRARGVS